MLKENLALLRGIYGYSQEEVSEKIGISRQAYAKWESGSTVPDIEKCSRLAELYGVSLDSMVSAETDEVPGLAVPPAPKGKNIWGCVNISDRGQVVIPKAARERFGLTGGQRLIVVSDETGIALIPAETFERNLRHFEEAARKDADK